MEVLCHLNCDCAHFLGKSVQKVSERLKTNLNVTNQGRFETGTTTVTKFKEINYLCTYSLAKIPLED